MDQLIDGIEGIQIAEKFLNKSPLRYPGGKTRACKKLENILINNFNTNDFDNLVSPFFGGGSFEFHIQNNYGLNIIANDKFVPLYNFWNTCKNENKKLCDELNKNLLNITKEKITVYVGSGITKDSKPENEWEEILKKSETMINALF